MGPSVRLLFMCGVTVPSTGESGVLLLDGWQTPIPGYTVYYLHTPSHTPSKVCVCEKERKKAKRKNILIVFVLYVYSTNNQYVMV